MDSHRRATLEFLESDREDSRLRVFEQLGFPARLEAGKEGRMLDSRAGQAICAEKDGPLEWSGAKLITGALIFMLITLAIFWYQFHRIQAGEGTPRLDQLRWGYFILILFFLPLEAMLLGLRMWVVCRVLQPGIRFWTCFQADLANSGIALLTPSPSAEEAPRRFTS